LQSREALDGTFTNKRYLRYLAFKSAFICVPASSYSERSRRSAATKHPAEFLAATAEWGTIERGKRADFILLSANPLTDIRNTSAIDAIAIGGKWMTRSQLDAMIARAASAVRVAP
jgi:cytosine/adenosine deaminase-related metal-dependent hydrolase